MRKSLVEIEKIDQYLRKELTPKESLMFHIQLLVSPALKEKLALQQKVHQVINWQAREEVRKELDVLHRKLMKQSAFSKLIGSIFTTH